MDQEDHDRLDKLIEGGYLQSDLQPIKCHKCESVDFIEEVKAIDGGVVSEMSVDCKNCGTGLGYFAYGNWDV